MWYKREALGQSNQVHQLQIASEGNANEKL